MRPSRRYAKKSKLVQKSRNQPVSILKKVAEEGTSSASNQVVLNSSWNEDEFVLRISDESDTHLDESNVPKSAHRKKVTFNDTVLLKKTREKVTPRNHATHAASSQCVKKPGILPKVNCMTAVVALEKLSESSLSQWMKPQKRLSVIRKVNSGDDFSKRTKRYCIKCVRIIPNASSKDDEPCSNCNTILVYHCVKCGLKSMTHLAILRHLEVKCYSRRSQAQGNATGEMRH